MVDTEREEGKLEEEVHIHLGDVEIAITRLRPRQTTCGTWMDKLTARIMMHQNAEAEVVEIRQGMPMVDLVEDQADRTMRPPHQRMNVQRKTGKVLLHHGSPVVAAATAVQKKAKEGEVGELVEEAEAEEVVAREEHLLEKLELWQQQ